MNRSLGAAVAGFTVGAVVLRRALRRHTRLDVGGCVAVITAGSRGLGLLIGRELGRLGARVVFAARDGDELSRARDVLRSYGVA
jgi:hypothetical protein